MTLATGMGSMPGDDEVHYTEAVRLVLGELPDLPHLPELPARGAGASMTGRGIAILADLGADLQPAGWRLTGSGSAGRDQRRARSLLSQDLDTLEEQAADHDGAFKIQVAGPWTLAATVERPRGDRVLADSGARRELAQALAEGVREHVAVVRRRLPVATRLIVQVDEPALPAVLAARVPTASGFGRHRSIHPPEASEALAWVFSAVVDAGAEPWAHCCAAGAPLGLLRGAGATGLSVDFSMLEAADHDALAEALEQGSTVALGIVPAVDTAGGLSSKNLAEGVLRWLDLIGADPADVVDRLVVTPTCGLAGASPTWVRQALETLRATATQLS